VAGDLALVGRRHEVARPQLIAQQSPPRHRVVSVMAGSLCQVAMVVRLTNPRRTVSRQLGALNAVATMSVHDP